MWKKGSQSLEFLHLALEEIKRNPSDSEKLIKILLEELKKMETSQRTILCP
jgi:hypothetical protein